MRTRCPACSTTFRVTPEQLRLKAGKVRCGQCLGVFNAFESLIEEEAPVSPLTPPQAEAPPAPLPPESPPAPAASSQEINPEPSDSAPQQDEVESISSTTSDTPAESVATEEPEESIADATQAARDAGLVAARELSETPAFNRWAAGTLASEAHIRFEPAQAEQPSWPFALSCIILLCVLLGQLLYHFRTEIVQRLPEMSRFYESATVDVPLPRNAELVGIEVSDLQADHARGLLVLQATLRNRANFAQAWPALELTLTDTHDTVISRRVLAAEEYLAPGSNTEKFPGRSDMAIKLWLEAKGIGASGYRLYLFYP